MQCRASLATCLNRGTLTYRRLRPPASSPVKVALTRANGATSPADKAGEANN